MVCLCTWTSETTMPGVFPLNTYTQSSCFPQIILSFPQDDVIFMMFTHVIQTCTDWQMDMCLLPGDIKIRHRTDFCLSSVCQSLSHEHKCTWRQCLDISYKLDHGNFHNPFNLCMCTVHIYSTYSLLKYSIGPAIYIQICPNKIKQRSHYISQLKNNWCMLSAFMYSITVNSFGSHFNLFL